ncbi:hypothetical protein CEP53_002231 [Fusarium sp. AF-6]|nr:hypothetical protein CEP53_002231 [Fusarium sp. AF-6]
MSEKFTSETIPSFDPPGFPFQDDNLTDDQKQEWSDTVSSWMDEEINAGYTDDKGVFHRTPGGREPNLFNRTPLTQFFNGRATPYNVKRKPISISWPAFPRLVAIHHDKKEDAWKCADENRDQQDEYLEWTVKRNKKGDIISVTFTCEGPEYWDLLARHDKNKLLSIYKACNPGYADQMKVKDFFNSHDGSYNPYNPWNGIDHLRDSEDLSKGFVTTNPGCIMHLAQRNNTLAAEVDIAAQATVIRKDADGEDITDKTKLCNCSQYGQPSRNSDPQIGISINGLARDGNKVSIANPVGIYITEFDTSNFKLEYGSGDLRPIPDGTFNWVRGNIDHNMGLRLHIEVPKGIMGTGNKERRQLIVHDIVDGDGHNIRYGGQFADVIRMCVNGVKIPGGDPAPSQPCPCGSKAPKDGRSMVAAAPPLDESVRGRRPPIKTRY